MRTFFAALLLLQASLLPPGAEAASLCLEYQDVEVQVNAHDCDCATCYNCNCHVSIGSCYWGECSSKKCWTSAGHCCHDWDCSYSCNCDTCYDTEIQSQCSSSSAYSVTSFEPSAVPVAGGGGETVRVYGEGFVNTGAIQCRFGSDELEVAGRFMSETEVDCEAPAVTSSATVQLQVTLDGEDWTDGQDFTFYACGDDCNSATAQGECQTDETCECAEGFVGDSCAFACPEGGDGQICSGVGVCTDGGTEAVCDCDADHYGAACGELCPQDADGLTCSGASRGVCQADGSCYCLPGFTGDLCAHNGTCTGGNCTCEPGYYGDGCSEICEATSDCAPGVGCSTVCSGHGLCSTLGSCLCDAGYWGSDCDSECPGGAADPCSGAGSCSASTGSCSCDYGSFGTDCSSECPGGADTPCSDHGTCSTSGLCACDAGYGSADCSVACPSALEGEICSGNGTCSSSDGTCDCDSDYWGDDCTLVCPGDPVCSGNGHCTTSGTCACVSGWYGELCDQECVGGHNDPCYGHGTCSPTTGACICDSGYGTADCSVACPTSADDGSLCSGNGVCDSATGACACASTYTGDACDERSCVSDCYGNGNCSADGVCECYEGWGGDYCSTISGSDVCSISLNPTRYTVVEGTGSLFVNVTRLGSTEWPVEVSYATADVSAHAGLDYVAKSGSLSWEAGDGSFRLVELVVLEDSTLEGVEMFEVRLSDPSAYAQLDQDTAYVQIEADVSDATNVYAVEHFLVLRPYSEIEEGTEAGETFKDVLTTGIAAAMGIGSEQVTVSSLTATSLNETLVAVDLTPAGSASATDLAEQLYGLIANQDPLLMTDDMQTYVQIDFATQPWYSLSADPYADDDGEGGLSAAALSAIAASACFAALVCGVAYWQRKSLVEAAMYRLAAYRFKTLHEERASAADVAEMAALGGRRASGASVSIHEVAMPSLGELE